MTKAEALHTFMASLGWDAYANQAPAGAAFPYLVYEQNIGGWLDDKIPTTVTLWDYSDSYKPILDMCEALTDKVTMGGVNVPYDGGTITIRRDGAFQAAAVESSDDKIKGRYVNLTLEYNS